jgi:single-stranded-DNA-specific exonuclease
MVCSGGLDKKFEGALISFGKRLLECDDFFVISHHDADGITSCAITVDFLRAHGKSVEFKSIKQIDSTTVSDIKKQSDKTIVFTDFGSGQHSLLMENGVGNYYVIDHHIPEREYCLQINPHDFGYDGASQISGAGMAYLLARSFGRRNMAPIAVVGAVGDMQDSSGKLESLNRIIVEDAVVDGVLAVENDLRMFGRQSRPLAQMLAYSSDPIFPGLTGDVMACSEFIESLGIPLKKGGEWRSYVELSTKEREVFFSALYMALLDRGVSEKVISSLYGEVYTLLGEAFKSELRDAKEYATVLNACGRQRSSELGVYVCLGDRGQRWMAAQSLLESHRRQLREGIEYLKDIGVDENSQFSFFDSDGAIDESIIGVIAGMAYGARIIPYDKPVLAFAQDRDDVGFLKISARANRRLVDDGVNLGAALRESSRENGGEGGGHNIAAGARIPKEKKEDFLKKMKEKLKSQRRV